MYYNRLLTQVFQQGTAEVVAYKKSSSWFMTAISTLFLFQKILHWKMTEEKDPASPIANEKVAEIYLNRFTNLLINV